MYGVMHTFFFGDMFHTHRMGFGCAEAEEELGGWSLSPTCQGSPAGFQPRPSGDLSKWRRNDDLSSENGGSFHSFPISTVIFYSFLTKKSGSVHSYVKLAEGTPNRSPDFETQLM